MKKSFSLIELIIIIIIVGVLYSSITFSLANTNLNQAADQIISHINYTRHLALKDNKMQYYPINNTKTEMNRSKYWFKQWWQIRFTRNKIIQKIYGMKYLLIYLMILIILISMELVIILIIQLHMN